MYLWEGEEDHLIIWLHVVDGEPLMKLYQGVSIIYG